MFSSASTSPLTGERIVVAMSGGVDSSVVAALCVEAGHETIGVTLQLYDQAGTPGRVGSCCAGTDIADARRVADRLGIAHYVLDYQSAFGVEVVDDFADSYLLGRTPVPCVRCNQTVKFRDLLGVARDLGATSMATGHYVRRVIGADGPELHRGIDPAKDQSYFLYATTRDQLDYLRFPLGGMSKQTVRAHARRLGLDVAAKPDSQDICFVPAGDYARVVRQLRPQAAAAGDIVDLEGKILGRHPGIVNFTVGQRRGLDIGGLSAPFYVVRIEPEQQRVVVGPRAALGVDALTLREFNWLGDEFASAGIDVEVKVRSMALQRRARLVRGTVPEIRFAEPEYGVSPGQAAVVYAGSRVLGGGWIDATTAALVAA